MPFNNDKKNGEDKKNGRRANSDASPVFLLPNKKDYFAGSITTSQ